MEQMPYYLPPEAGWKRRLEGVIPIIILIIIGVVILGKTTNMLCGVPGLSSVFCASSQTMIGIVGTLGTDGDTQIDAAVFQDVLNQEGAKWKIYSKPVSAAALQSGTAALKDINILVLAGKQNLDFKARDTIGQFVKDGGKLIVIGDAGIGDPKDDLLRGWSAAALGDVMPVKFAITGSIEDIPTLNIDQPLFDYVSVEHPILKPYGESYQVNLSKVLCSAAENSSTPALCAKIRTACANLTAMDVVPKAEASEIAWLTAGDNSKSAIGIIEKGTGFGGGKVLYFNYDPGCTRYASLAAVLYLSGR